MISLTDAARNKILDYLSSANDANLVASIAWCRFQGDSNWKPMFGFYRRSDLLDKQISSIDGLEIALAIPDDVISRLKERQLDFQRGEFILR